MTEMQRDEKECVLSVNARAFSMESLLRKDCFVTERTNFKQEQVLCPALGDGISCMHGAVQTTISKLLFSFVLF